jgi:sorbitol-specific phosphotransferase system component IIC
MQARSPITTDSNIILRKTLLPMPASILRQSPGTYSITRFLHPINEVKNYLCGNTPRAKQILLCHIKTEVNEVKRVKTNAI